MEAWWIVAIKIGALESGNFILRVSNTLGLFWYQSLAKYSCYNGSVTKTPFAILHATRASLEPVNQYYAANAPELDLYNLLDDGLMRYLDANDMSRATRRFLAMLEVARDEYGAKMAMLTCSAVPASTMEELRGWDPAFPVIKIDEPMAKMAVAQGSRIAIMATFPATIATTQALLEAAGAKAVHSICVREALQALFDGDPAQHNRLIHKACADLVSRAPTDVLVLAQVSMAHLVDEVRASVRLPVFGSLDTSLAAVKSALFS